MSAAAVLQRFCWCGCGKAVKGKANYFDAACRQRAHRAAEPVFPRYTSATERLAKCETHGEVYQQRTHQFLEPRGSGKGMNYGLVIWTGECPKCQEREKARLEALKPKPTSPCALRTCDCASAVPPCPICNKPLSMLPGTQGMHEFGCVKVPGCGPVRPVSVGDEKRREMANPEMQFSGDDHLHRPGGRLFRAWREN